MTAEEIIKRSLQEDIGDGDHTSLATIPAEAIGKARLIVKQDGVISGLGIAEKVFRAIQEDIFFEAFKSEGDRVKKGDIAFIIQARTRTILTGERLALNFLQRMSGIATFTASLCSKLEGLPVKILDTRKTTPLMREFEKMAVRAGGAHNHRMGLYDMIMIKDNHVDYAGGIPQAIRAVKKYLTQKSLDLQIEIEVRNFDELNQVLETGGVHRIMLDNFSIGDLRKAVGIINGKYETEASGGINQDNIREYGETGVDYISVGALTHQIKSLDMSLKAIK